MILEGCVRIHGLSGAGLPGLVMTGGSTRQQTRCGNPWRAKAAAEVRGRREAGGGAGRGRRMGQLAGGG